MQYSLPTISDPNTCQTITTSAIETVSGVLPSYASFTTPSNLVMQFSPTDSALIGTYTYQVTLSDTMASTSTTFTLSILNTAPAFSSALASQTV